MALIGQGAHGVGIDYSPVADSAWKLANSTSNAIGGLLGTAVDITKKRKEDKDKVKTSAEIIDAAMKLYPESAAALTGISESLKDEERPLSERASLGSEVGGVIDMAVRQRESAFKNQMALENLALDKADSGIRQSAAEREGRVFESNWEIGQREKAADEEIAAQTVPLILEQAIGMSQSIEQNGGKSPIPSELMINTLSGGTTEEKRRMAEVFTSMLPKEQKPEFRDIPITIDGQPGTATSRWNPDTGTFDIVPVRSGAWGDGSGGDSIESGVFTAPSTNYSFGKDVGGPDEMQDSWTNKGYSSTGKNLAPGVAAVNPKVYKHGTVFQDADTGEVFIAADSHGNKNPNVIDVFQPPGEYERSNKPRNFRVVGFEDNVGKTPQEITQQREKWAQVANGGRVTPGAVKSGRSAQTPTQQAIDEENLAKLKAEREGAAGAQEAKSREANAKQANSQRVLSVISKYKTPDGKPTQALKDAVGRGEEASSFLSSWTGGLVGNEPETRANQKELQIDLLETDLLNAAKDLKPVSEDEMKMLLSRRPALTDPPEVWARYIARAESIIRNGMGDAAPPAQVSATDRLRGKLGK